MRILLLSLLLLAPLLAPAGNADEPTGPREADSPSVKLIKDASLLRLIAARALENATAHLEKADDDLTRTAAGRPPDNEGAIQGATIKRRIAETRLEETKEAIREIDSNIAELKPSSG